MNAKVHPPNQSDFRLIKNEFRGIQDIDLIEEIKKILDLQGSDESQKQQKLVKQQEK